MSTATRVGAFGAGLVLAFGAGLGAGHLVGPLDPAVAPPHPAMTTHGAGPGVPGTTPGDVVHRAASTTDHGGSSA